MQFLIPINRLYTQNELKIKLRVEWYEDHCIFSFIHGASIDEKSISPDF
jgi:hypothetical protein